MKFFIIFYMSIGFAFGQQQVILNKGDLAPYDGILSDKEQMKQYREINENNKRLEKQNIKLKDLVIVNEKKADFFKEEMEQYKTEASIERTRSFWSKVGYFALGAVLTGVAAKVAIESTR